MRSRTAVVVALVGFAAFVAAAGWSGHTAAQSPFGDPNAEPAPFNPQMAALMSMLIQPRHAKLGLPGKADWPLAGYALKELKQGFVVTSRAVPRWKGLPVPDLFDAALTQPFTLLDFAIKLGYRRQFDEAYDTLTKGCNACHATTDHSFVVIKAPDVSSFPNQDSSRSASACFGEEIRYFSVAELTFLPALPRDPFVRNVESKATLKSWSCSCPLWLRRSYKSVLQGDTIGEPGHWFAGRNLPAR